MYNDSWLIDTNTNNPPSVNGVNGKSLEFDWQGTQLGIRVEGEVNYTYVDLQGIQGLKGDKGDKGDTGLPGTTDYNQLQNTPAINSSNVANSIVLRNLANQFSTGRTIFNPPETNNSIALSFNHGYNIYADNVGLGSSNSRFWIAGISGGSVYIAPRSSTSTFELIQLRATKIELVGKINLISIPTSSTGLSTGDVWRDSNGFLRIA